MFVLRGDTLEALEVIEAVDLPLVIARLENLAELRPFEEASAEMHTDFEDGALNV